jgi:hypothetical protein
MARIFPSWIPAIPHLDLVATSKPYLLLPLLADLRIPSSLKFDGAFDRPENITFGARAATFVLSAPSSCRNMN